MSNEKHTVIFLVGEPAVGKTSAIRSLLGEFFMNMYLPEKSIKFTMKNKLVLSGHYTGKTFDGSDTIPFNGAQKNFDYWRDNIFPSRKYKCTIFDGDRFSYRKILDQIKILDCNIVCLLLYCEEHILNERRRKRGIQDERWLKTRKTKVKNFVNLFPIAYTYNTAINPPEDVANFIKRYTNGSEN